MGWSQSLVCNVRVRAGWVARWMPVGLAGAAATRHTRWPLQLVSQPSQEQRATRAHIRTLRIIFEPKMPYVEPSAVMHLYHELFKIYRSTSDEGVTWSCSASAIVTTCIAGAFPPPHGPYRIGQYRRIELNRWIISLNSHQETGWQWRWADRSTAKANHIKSGGYGRVLSPIYSWRSNSRIFSCDFNETSSGDTAQPCESW